MLILAIVAGSIVCVAVAVLVNNALGKPVPFLRWSFIRMCLGVKKLVTEWQVGDGREDAAADYVLSHARPGDVDDAIAKIDEFAYRYSTLINIGDEKGAILDAAINRCQPKQVLELGAYIGYSALRIARRLPDGGHVYSVEFNACNAGIAGRIVEHAGMSDLITFIVGSIGDAGATLKTMRNLHGFTAECLDLVFLDHHGDLYTSDLQHLHAAGWLHPGSVVVADNVGFPGAPEYRTYMQEQEGQLWKTQEHKTHVEYQSLIRDVVLESTLLT